MKGSRSRLVGSKYVAVPVCKRSKVPLTDIIAVPLDEISTSESQLNLLRCLFIVVCFFTCLQGRAVRTVILTKSPTMDNPCCPNSNRACFHDAPVWLRRKSLLLCRPKVISCWFGVYEGKTFKHIGNLVVRPLSRACNMAWSFPGRSSY
jgi:hypothetical protein